MTLKIWNNKVQNLEYKKIIVIGGPDGPTKFRWPRSKIKGTSLGKWELLKIAKFRPGGWKTARRAAKRPPTGKPKLSRVTSGYGGLMIPLSRVRPTQKNGGYIGVA